MLRNLSTNQVVLFMDFFKQGHSGCGTVEYSKLNAPVTHGRLQSDLESAQGQCGRRTQVTDPDSKRDLLRTVVTWDSEELRILPTQCIYVFRIVLTINSGCFPKPH
jgi:hypothetical protein